jgi:hypothetical protein
MWSVSTPILNYIDSITYYGTYTVKLWLIDGDKYINGGLENITTIILSPLFFTKLHKKRIIGPYKVEAGLL